MALASRTDRNEFSALMPIGDWRGYVMIAVLVFVGFIMLVFIAEGGKIKFDGGDYLVLLFISLFTGLLSWLSMWLIFGLFKIPPAKTAIDAKGLRVQNAYGFSSELTWADIKAVKASSIPFFSQLVYLEAKNGIVYCMGRQYREKARFMDVLDRFAPKEHPLRTFYL